MELAERVFRGGVWLSVGNFSLTLLGLFKLVFYANFLNPEELGVFYLALAVLAFALLPVDIGTSTWLVQRQWISQRMLSLVFSANIWSAGIIVLILAFSTGIGFFVSNSPDLWAVSVVVGSGVICFSISNTHRFWLIARLRFGKITTALVISEMLGLLIAFVMLKLDFGLSSLVTGVVVSQIANCVLLILLTGVSLKLSPIVGFLLYNKSVFITLSVDRIFKALAANLDKILIYQLGGAFSLGIFNMANQIATFPLPKLSQIANNIALPAYSIAHNKKRDVSDAYFLCFSFFCVLYFPYAFFLIGNSDSIVDLAFPDGYSSLKEIVPILGFVGLFKCTCNPGGVLFLALRREMHSLRFSIGYVFSLTVILVLFLVVDPSVKSAALGLLCTSVALTVVWHFLVSGICRIRYRQVISFVLRLIVVCAVAVSMSLWTVDFLIRNSLLADSYAILLSNALLFGLLYFVGIWISYKSTLMSVIAMFRK